MTQENITQITILFFCSVILTGCPTERFRHEKYNCNSSAFGIAEIILNDTGIGDQATIIGYGSDRKAKIQSSSKKSITMATDELKIDIDRDSAIVTVKRKNRIAVLSCAKSVFKM